jgi:hypothetical protein
MASIEERFERSPGEREAARLKFLLRQASDARTFTVAGAS